jgi:hypothetical protein
MWYFSNQNRADEIRKLRTSLRPYENGRIPFRVKSLARVGMLVQMRTVEGGQPVRIVGKVRGHPVQDHADAVVVQVVDEVHQILGGAVPRGGREISGRLITPRAVKRVLGDGHEFDVRKTQILQIVRHGMREFAVVHESAVLAAPRAQMRLIDRHGRIESVARAASRHPRAVAPFVIQFPGARCRGGREFAEEADWIGLVQPTGPIAGYDAILIGLPVLHPF